MFPFRPGGGDYRRHDHERFDRHGVPRCKHCGAATTFVRFSPGDRTRPPGERHPYLTVACTTGITPGCAGQQRIRCEESWRHLIPLWRDDPLYFELKESHGSYEAQHDYWRDRYKVAADDIGVRPKVRDIAFHRLRANVACLIEWLRICVRQGWLGDAPRNRRGTERKFKEKAERAAARFAEMRQRIGLLIPYGPKAVQLFPGTQVTPPSRRPRGAPPGQTALDIPA